jgi:hypothetical protein
MPAIPNVPGVPVLSSYSALGTLSILAGDALTVISGLFLPRWGIFQNGVEVVLADNVVALDFKREWNVADFPLEQGAFESYDKVSVPYEARVRFSSGGSQANRQDLIASIDSIAGTLALFDIVTPEVIYTSVNIVHYDYRRTADHGAGLIIVDVTCRQIRLSGQSSFANTASPSGASPIGGGQKTAQPPTSQEATAAEGAT